MAEQAGSELYVGYLRTPRGYVRFLRVVVPAAVGVLAGVAVMLARTQGDPGPAVWEDASPRVFVGVVSGGPSPVLFAVDRGDGRAGPMLVVASGKHGAVSRLGPFAGQRVTLKGTLLKRGEGRMIELDDGEDAVAGAAGEAELPAVVAKGRVTLRGEIVDSKCYLGAMKPGEGRPHKECATLCISGGIPPTLLYRAENGSTGSCLLVDAGGGPLDEGAYPYIADPVEVTGELEEQGGVQRLRVRVADIVRL